MRFFCVAFCLSGCLVWVSGLDCGWPSDIALRDDEADIKTLSLNLSRIDSRNGLNCSTKIVSPQGARVHVQDYQITNGLTFSFNEIDLPVQPESDDVSWGSGRFAEDMTFPAGPVNVRFWQRPGQPSAGKGFILHISYLSQSKVFSCLENIKTLQADVSKTRLLFSPGYPFTFNRGIQCHWNIEAPENYVLSVKLASVSTAFNEINRLSFNDVSALVSQEFAGQTRTEVTLKSQEFGSISALDIGLPMGFVIEYTAVPMEHRVCNGTIGTHAQTLSAPAPSYVLEWVVLHEDGVVLDCQLTFDTGSDSRVTEVTLIEYQPRIPPHLGICANQTFQVEDSQTGVILVNEGTNSTSWPCPETISPLATVRASGRAVKMGLSELTNVTISRESGARLTLLVKSRDQSPSRDIDDQVLDTSLQASSFAWIPAQQINNNGKLLMTLGLHPYASCSRLEVLDHSLASSLTPAQKMSVFNGPSDTATFELTEDCNGNKISDSVIFMTRLATIRVTKQNEGFWIKYKASDKGNCPRLYTPVIGKSYKLPDTLKGQNNLRCAWRIENNAGLIKVKTNVSLSGADGDSFSIHERNSSRTLLAGAARIDPELWLFSRDNLTILLGVEKSSSDTDLEFDYEPVTSPGVQESCPGRRLTATETTQEERTPNFPNYILPDLDCQWTIARAAPEHLTVLEFSSGLSVFCIGSIGIQVKVFQHSEGDTTVSETDICGEDAKQGFTRAFRSEIVLVNVKTSTPLHPGLSFNYYTVNPADTEYSSCNKTIELDNGPLSTNLTFLPQHFSGPTQCWWRFTTGSDDKAVKLTDIRFAFKKSSSPNTCFFTDSSVSFMSVVDNQTFADSTYCSYMSDEPIVSQQGEMIMYANILKRPMHPVALTFSADTTPVTGCEGTVMSLSAPASGEWHKLSSPGYPANYPAESNCVWLLKSEDKSKIIEINILDLDIPQGLTNAVSCGANNGDKLAIFAGKLASGEFSTYYEYYQLCGDDKQQESFFSTTGPEAKINFFSDSQSEGKGFQLRYRAVPYEDPDLRPSSASDIGIILGGVAGGLVVFAALGVLVGYLTRRRGKRGGQGSGAVYSPGQGQSGVAMYGDNKPYPQVGGAAYPQAN